MQIIRQQNARKLHFFDYSLWNHYVKDLLMPLFSAASALSFHFSLSTLPFTLCLFYTSLCLFMLKTSFKKDTTPVFLSYLCRYCCFVIVLIVLFLGSSRNMVP